MEAAETELEEPGTDELEELGFKIDGTVYPVPTLDTFDMDEAQILYDEARLTIEDFVPPGDEVDEEERFAHMARISQSVKNPAFLRALMIVAYRRGNPKLPLGRARDVIRGANLMQAMSDFLKASAAAARRGDPRIPPAQATEQQQPSDTSSVDLSSSSGNGSRRSSDEPAESPEPTGATRSGTLPTSVRTGSVE